MTGPDKWGDGRAKGGNKTGYNGSDQRQVPMYKPTRADKQRTAPTPPLPNARSRWQTQAACGNQTADYWFPTDIEGSSGEDIRRRHAYRRQAIAICNTCPVKQACAELARTIHPHDGIWAGIEWAGGHPKHRGQEELL